MALEEYAKPGYVYLDSTFHQQGNSDSFEANHGHIKEIGIW